MKIAILELHNYHYDMINFLCRIFEKNIEKLYLIEELMEKIENKDKIKKIEVVNSKLKIMNSIKLIYSINKLDIEYIILGTNQKYLFFYLFFFLFCNKKIIMTIHNINVYFEYRKDIKGIIKFIIRKIMLKNCYAINVLGENLKQTLINKNINKKILNIPVRIYNEKNKKEILNSINKLTIAIPGSFEQKRRDYLTVYKAFKTLRKNGYNIIINFLGNCNSKEKVDLQLLEKFKKLGNIYYRNYFITEEEFKKKMAESDIILNPNVEKTTYDGIVEFYGKTKQSGGIYTQIEFAKPSINAFYLKVDSVLETSTLYYRNELDLYNLITCIYNNPNYQNKLKREALKNSEYFTLKKIRKRLELDLKQGDENDNTF